jgi:hypothetical protein
MTDMQMIENDISQEAENQIDKAKERFRQTRNKLQSQVRDAWGDVIEVVRKHPGKALGAAIATGMVVGLSLSRRRSSSASSQLRDLADHGADAWDRIKGGFNEAVCNLKDALDDATEKFK